MEMTFAFERLMLPDFGEGVLFYGEAVLIDNHGETDSFIVQDINLGNMWLPHVPRGGPGTIGTCLFKAISDVLYDDKSTLGKLAALEWADFVSGEMPAVPMFKRRAGLDALVHGARI